MKFGLSPKDKAIKIAGVRHKKYEEVKAHSDQLKVNESSIPFLLCLWYGIEIHTKEGVS